MLEQRRQALRDHIRNEQLIAYFQKVREAAITRIAFRELNLSGEDILNQLTQHRQDGADFNCIYQFLEHQTTIPEGLGWRIAYEIINYHRREHAALSSLCLLLQKCSNIYILLQEHASSLRLLIEDNLLSSTALAAALILLNRIISQSQRKELFAWLPPLYPQIIQQTGCGIFTILFLGEASKNTLFLPSYEVMATVAETKIEYGSQQASCSVIGEMLLHCFAERNKLEDFGLVVVWVATQLKSHSQPSLRAYLLEVMLSLLKMEASQPFVGEIIQRNHEIIDLLLVCCTEGNSKRSLAVDCICIMITSLSDTLILRLASTHCLAEPLGRAFQLHLDNKQKFCLLSSLALLFELLPEQIREFATHGVIQGIIECEDSEFLQLRQMGKMLIEQFQLYEY